MLYFELLFPLIMILSPLVVLFTYPPVEGADLEAVRILRKKLIHWTVLVAGGFLALVGLRLYFRAEVGPQEAYGALGRPLDQFLAYAFFPLWFGLAVPLIRAARPNMEAGPKNPSPVRTASLVPRQTLQVLPRWVEILPIGIFAVSVALALLNGFGSSEVRTADNILVGALFALAAFLLTLQPHLMRWVLTEPEPTHGHPTEALERAYASYRRTKAFGILLLGLVMQVLVGTIALLLVTNTLREGNAGEIMGWVGGLGGAGFGTTAGLYGAWVGFQRSRIQELLNTNAKSEA